MAYSAAVLSRGSDSAFFFLALRRCQFHNDALESRESNESLGFKGKSMASKRTMAIVALSMLAPCSLLFGQNAAAPAAPCDAPSYFGMCDPYVPGIIAFNAPNGGVEVKTTWPSGPADQAGLCPGDRIVSANSTPTSGLKFMDIIKLIVSDTPKPIDLKIKRGDQNLSFHLARIKETELAALSHEKYTRLPIFPSGADELSIVPSDESPTELQAFQKFELEVGRRNGFKPVGGRWAPIATDEGQFQRLEQVLNDPMSSRLAHEVVFVSSAYQPGFSALLLEHPDQLLAFLIEPGSPAFRAGLLPGDEITEVDGHSVSGLDPGQLADLVMKPDDHAREITLRIRRGTADQTLKIETEKWQDAGYGLSLLGIVASQPGRPGDFALGIQLVNPGNPQEMVVRSVDYPSAAFAAGMHIGDKILAVNGRPAKQISREEMKNILESSSPAPLRIDAMRLDKKIHFQLTPMTEAQAQVSIGRKMTAHGPTSAKCTEPATQP